MITHVLDVVSATHNTTLTILEISDTVEKYEAGLDEGILSLYLHILFRMWNPPSDNKWR